MFVPFVPIIILPATNFLHTNNNLTLTTYLSYLPHSEYEKLSQKPSFTFT